jgi:YHS domain-containing protein
MTGGKILDPICDMTVDLEEARAEGLVTEYADREYGFCSAGCQVKFAESQTTYVPKVEAWLATSGDHAHTSQALRAQGPLPLHATSGELPNIDAGLRAWYSSCRCCLSDAYPRVVEALDKERETMREAPADAGICETAEATETKNV